MCGIAGVIVKERHDAPLDVVAKEMATAISYRGPDNAGIWVDEQHHVALTHRRLAIVDLTEHGHQPMHSASKRYIISFNGEIYNFQSLRQQLQADWVGHSDTEVMLAAIEQWGLEKALKEFNGMFAFALWDNKTRTLTLARDRMGEKPLYYGHIGGYFAFASELKALHTLVDSEPRLNRDALGLYMQYCYIPAPHSIYEGIYKLQPGHYLQINADTLDAKTQPYWQYRDFYTAPYKAKDLSDTQTIDRCETLLRDSIQRQMVADVPLGAFLSGGIDSSTVTAIMQSLSEKPVKTFSIGFEEESYNEAPYAQAVAKHLNTDHHELIVSPREAQEVIPSLSMIYDEPFADSSQIPTYLVAKLARQHVTVALSGDAGDELFGGYNRYLQAPAIWNNVTKLPLPLRKATLPLLIFLNMRILNPLMGNSHSKYARLLNKLTNYYEKIMVSDREAFYLNLCSQTASPQLYVQNCQPHQLPAEDYMPHLAIEEWMMLMDMLTYLPGDILAKVDRAAMRVSLETRIPFLDKEIVEFASTVPLSQKIRDGKGKWLIRQLLYKYVPKELIERPKVGFAIPIGNWLRGPLKSWADDLLDTNTLHTQGYFHATEIRKIWQEHLGNKRDHTHRLWNILMFQSWLNTYHPRQFKG